MSICREPGCPTIEPCRVHERVSSRNHRGVARQARGHGAAFDRAVRQFRAEARVCALQLPGCTELATSADYTRPGDWTSPLQPACGHCQNVQGAAFARTAR